MKKDTVHPMIWNFDTSTPSYEYDEHDGYSWRLVNFEDILPWFGDPLFIITRGIEQHLLSVAGIIQRDMNRYGICSLLPNGEAAAAVDSLYMQWYSWCLMRHTSNGDIEWCSGESAPNTNTSLVGHPVLSIGATIGHIIAIELGNGG